MRMALVSMPLLPVCEGAMVVKDKNREDQHDHDSESVR